MKRLSFLFCFVVLITFTACKTQEDIRREKVVENLNEQVAQVAQTQKSTASNTANANSRFMAIESQLAQVTGQLEETLHNKQQETKERTLFQQRLSTIEEKNTKQSELIKTLADKIQEQSTYIEQVLKTLNSLTEQQKEVAPKKKGQKKGSKQETQAEDLEIKETKTHSPNHSETTSVSEGIAQFKAKDYTAAKSIFNQILETKKVSRKDKEAAFLYLGQIEYKNKNYEEAKVYFSKLFSENPDSSYGASALLSLAKTFIQLKSKEEASQSLNELITRFPKAKETQEGVKLKTKL